MNDSEIVAEIKVPRNLQSAFERERWSWQVFQSYVRRSKLACQLKRTSSFDTMTGHTALYTDHRNNQIVLTSIEPKNDRSKLLISKKVYPISDASVIDKINHVSLDCSNERLTYSPFVKLSNVKK